MRTIRSVLLPSGIWSPGLHASTVVLNDGGSAGGPSACSSPTVNVIQSSCPGPDGELSLSRGQSPSATELAPATGQPVGPVRVDQYARALGRRDAAPRAVPRTGDRSARTTGLRCQLPRLCVRGGAGGGYMDR